MDNLCTHSWDGCKCTECGETRDEQHDWVTGGHLVDIEFSVFKGGRYCCKCGLSEEFED